MLELKFVASIAERDIDLLLLEELSVSVEFREWFATRTFGEPCYQSHVGAWHSVCDSQLGESDLVFVFEGENGPRTAVLVENKIDATPRPEQGGRYRLRGEKGVREGYWERYKTCVLAPNRYLESSRHSESYDVELAYEEILAYFQSRRSRDSRFGYKATVVLEAIEQNRRGYQPQYNEQVTTFVENYHELAQATHPELGMHQPKPRPAGSTWVSFSPAGKPKDVELVHQLTAGYVKVFFQGRAQDFATLEHELVHRLPPDATMAIAGKAAAIAIPVEKLELFEKSFEEQLDAIELALAKLSVLWQSIQ